MRRFLEDGRGNVAVMFGLALIPLLGMVGAAMDYTRAADQLSRLQAAVDATTLNLTALPATATAAEIQAAADAAVRPYLSNDQVRSSLSVTAVRTGNTIQISANGQMPTRIMSVLGINNVPLSASSASTWGNTRVRVALALDVTGSMAANNKLGSLKTAATNLITQMQSSAQVDGDVYVSIVPFAKDVNVGSSNYGASWLKWSGAADTWDENNGSCNIAYTAPAAGTSQKTACESKGECRNSAGTVQASFTTQASCTGAGECRNSAGTVQTSLTTQATCTGAGTCSKSGPTTQSTCTATGTCSNPSYTTQSTCVNQCTKSGYSTQSTCTAAGTCSNSSYTTQSTCTSYGYCVKRSNGQTSTTLQGNCNTANSDWTAFTWTPATWMTMTWTPATWAAHTWSPHVWVQGAWTSASRSTWNGCVMDRDQNYDTTNTAPGATSPTLFPAEQHAACPAQLMPLSYDWTALKAKIASFAANGATNQQIGLAWAYQTLTASPMSVPAKDPAYAYKQALVLLTDGTNTQSRAYTTASQIDDRQRLLCTEIKAAGITIYAAQVNTTGAPTQQVLQDCASTGKFKMLTSGAEIVDYFGSLATDLARLRLTH